jgi:hypothetical protein
MWTNDVPSSHSLLFYYATVSQGLRARRSGIPAHVKYGGVPLSLRPPHDCINHEYEVFRDYSSITQQRKQTIGFASSSSEVAVSNMKIVDSVAEDDAFPFPNEEVIVLSLPRKFLQQLPGYEDDHCMCLISSQILRAMKPTSYTAVLNPRPWLAGVLMIPPECILRSYWIFDNLNNEESQYQKKSSSNNNPNQLKFLSTVEDNRNLWKDTVNNIDVDAMVLDDESPSNINSSFRQLQDVDTQMIAREIKTLDSVETFTHDMLKVRMVADDLKLVPLYHYTSLSVAPLIMKGGLRMSTQGQGDGGVYVSTQGPASYGLGTDDYEVNIIKDCFGLSRVAEYKGKGCLDVVIIYGCEASVLEQVSFFTFTTV